MSPWSSLTRIQKRYLVYCIVSGLLIVLFLAYFAFDPKIWTIVSTIGMACTLGVFVSLLRSSLKESRREE